VIINQLRTVSVEILDSVDLRSVKDTLITVKIMIYGIVFVDIHGVRIGIVQEDKIIFSLRKILHVTTFASECPQLLELYAKKLKVLISRHYFCNEKVIFYML